jgi:hypothetical protein
MATLDEIRRQFSQRHLVEEPREQPADRAAQFENDEKLTSSWPFDSPTPPDSDLAGMVASAPALDMSSPLVKALRRESDKDPRRKYRPTHAPVRPEIDLGLVSTEEAAAIEAAISRKARYLVLDGPADAVILFGKHRGKKVSELASSKDGRDYLRWVSGEDFPSDLLKVIRICLTKTRT